MKRLIFFIIVLCAAIVSPAAGETGNLHNPWHGLLQKYVQNGMVDYKGFAAGGKKLDAYLAALETEDISAYSREQQLAFWINAYNAFTIKLILDHYPIESIRDIGRPWKRRFCKAAGQTHSLDHIEHEILRKQLKEPRIHFAVVCASIGCPDLQPGAFVPEKIDRQLDQAAQQFFSSRKHFYIEQDGKTVIIRISKIFDWFGGDFGQNKTERVAFMLPYLDQTTAEQLKTAAAVKFKYLHYDWSLNDKEN
jgi:hypothetical protein